jgi:chemotaxis protein MotB
MSRQDNAAPVVIRRKKVVAGGGRHGGAWKVAYADFVTAMMAFFLMMWLLGATTESQRRGLADYFNPSVPIHRIASGGESMLGGNDLQTREQMGPANPDSAIPDDAGTGPETESFSELRERLAGLGGESALIAQALRHVVTRLTDEGLVIEMFDLPDAPLFEGDTDVPAPVLRTLAQVLAEVLEMADNPLALEGHVRSVPVVRAVDPRWSLSTARAGRLRELLESAGVDPARVARVTGHADRRPAAENPMAARNNRLELILLRRQRSR